MALKPVTFGEKELKKIFRTDTVLGRFWQRSKRLIKSAIYFLLLFSVFFLAINFPAYRQRANYSVKDVPVITLPPPPAPTISYSPEIIIPKLGLEAPVIYDAPYSSILDRLKEGVVRYEGTADPGQVGNVVILGHSSDFPWSNGQFKTIFAVLDQLSAGDKIILPYGSQRYTYTVSVKEVVKANNLSVLNRTGTPTLTLITCYPVGTALNRLIIRAELSEGPIGSVQTTEPYQGNNLVSPR